MSYRAVSLDEAQQVADLLLEFLRGVRTSDNDPVAELPLAQLRLCSVLARGPRPMSEISREIGTSLSAVTQIADRLERAGLIKRMPRGDDRRVRCLQLTEQGEKMMRVHEEMRIGCISNVLDRLSGQERQMVLGALELLARASVAARDGEPGADGHAVHPATSKVLL
jgi:DNA-binding MarR family transcriptional regulator